MPNFLTTQTSAGVPEFETPEALSAWANMQARSGVTGLFWVILAGVGVAVTFTMVGAVVTWYAKKGETSGSDIPTPPEGSGAEGRRAFASEDILCKASVERDVLVHLRGFLQSEEAVKFDKAIKDAEKRKYRFPRKFFANPDDALAFLGSKEIGVEVGEKAFRSAWNKGLPAEKRREDKADKKDPTVAAIEKLGETLGDKIDALPVGSTP